jgi:hypothetical protein
MFNYAVTDSVFFETTIGIPLPAKKENQIKLATQCMIDATITSYTDVQLQRIIQIVNLYSITKIKIIDVVNILQTTLGDQFDNYCKPSQTEDQQAAAISRFADILSGYCDHTCSCIFVTKASKGETDGIDNIKKAVKKLSDTTQKPHFVFLAYASQIAQSDASRHKLETNSTGITSQRDFDDALMRTLLVKLKTIDSRKTVTLLTCDKFDEYIPFSLIGFSMIINIPDKSSVVVFSDAIRTPAYRPFEIGNSYLQLIVENKTVAFTKEGVTVVGSIPRFGEKDVELLSYSSPSAPPDPRVPPATAVKATASVSTSAPLPAPAPAPVPTLAPKYTVGEKLFFHKDFNNPPQNVFSVNEEWIQCTAKEIKVKEDGAGYEYVVLPKAVYITLTLNTIIVPEIALKKNKTDVSDYKPLPSSTIPPAPAVSSSSFSLTTQQQPPYSLYDMPSDRKKPKCRVGHPTVYNVYDDDQEPSQEPSQSPYPSYPKPDFNQGRGPRGRRRGSY